MSIMTKQHAYITTAIPYVNGLPHIGHAMDYMLADVWARYQRQNGREVRFQTGVDEHGNKIAAKAASQNQTPQAYVDQMHGNFQNMIAELNISPILSARLIRIMLARCSIFGESWLRLAISTKAPTRVGIARVARHLSPTRRQLKIMAFALTTSRHTND